MARKYRKLCALLALLLVLALPLSACGDTNGADNGDASRAEVRYTIGTASASGAHYAIGVLFSEALSNHSDYLRLFPQTTGGGEDNGVNVANGEYDFGFWNCDSITTAQSGDSEPYLPNLRGVMTVQCQAAHYIARNDSGIETWEDCAGKRVGVATTNTVSQMITRAILAHYGIDCDEDLESFIICGNDEAREKIADGDLDLIYIGGGFPLSGVIELMSTGDYHLLSTPQEDLEEIFAKGYEEFSFEYYGPYVIGAGTYPNQDEDITVAGGRNLVFTRDDIPEEDVYEFLRVIYEQWDSIKVEHLALSNLDWAEMPKTGVPLHPGAEKFYRDMGLLPEE